MATTEAPPARKERSAKPGEGSGDRPCHVVVLNDSHNTFEHVARSLARYVPGVDFERGMALANLIHSRGRARVWSGSREQAELYWEQLQGAGLTMAPLED